MSLREYHQSEDDLDTTTEYTSAPTYERILEWHSVVEPSTLTTGSQHNPSLHGFSTSSALPTLQPSEWTPTHHGDEHTSMLSNPTATSTPFTSNAQYRLFATSSPPASTSNHNGVSTSNNDAVYLSTCLWLSGVHAQPSLEAFTIPDNDQVSATSFGHNVDAAFTNPGGETEQVRDDDEGGEMDDNDN